MAKAESERQGFELLEACERMLARLYAGYAELFPADQAFWSRLAADETKHAEWVAAFLAAADTTAVEFREGRLAIETFTTFLEYLQHRHDEARHTPPTPVQALAIARDIEHTLVERSFFEAFTSESAEARRVLATLHTDTERHRAVIDAEWERRRAATA